MGWGDLDDGPLLDAMAGRFDALVTVDRSLPTEQRLALREALDDLRRGQARELRAAGK